MLKKMRFLMIGVVFSFVLARVSVPIAEAYHENPCWGGTVQEYRVDCSFFGDEFPNHQCLGIEHQMFKKNGTALGFDELERFGYKVRYKVGFCEKTSTVVIIGRYPNRQKMVINFFFNCDGNEDAPYLINMGGNISSGVYFRGQVKSHTSCTLSKNICPIYLGDDGEAGVGAKESVLSVSIAEKVMQMLLQEQEHLE